MIMRVLEEFRQCSRERVNKAKTNIFFSKNVSPREIRSISSKSGFITMENLGKYLGSPILHNRVNKDMYQEVIDRVEKRLSGRNAMHLSLAGRVTLN